MSEKTTTELVRYLEYLDEEQQELILATIKLLSNSMYDRRALADLAKHDGVLEGTFDTAYPIGIADHIREVYPSSNKASFVYDYSVKSFGTLENINDVFMAKLHKVLSK